MLETKKTFCQNLGTKRSILKFQGLKKYTPQIQVIKPYVISTYIKEEYNATLELNSA